MRVVRNNGAPVRAPVNHFVDDEGELYEEVSEAEADELSEEGVDLIVLVRSADLADDDEDGGDEGDE